MSFQFDHWEIDDNYLNIIERNKSRSKSFDSTNQYSNNNNTNITPRDSPQVTPTSQSSKEGESRTKKRQKTVKFNEKAKIILIPCRKEYDEAGIDLWYHRQDQILAQNELHQEINDMKIHHPKLSFRSILDYLFHLHPQIINVHDKNEDIPDNGSSSSFPSNTSLPTLEKVEGLSPLSIDSLSSDQSEESNYSSINLNNEEEFRLSSGKDSDHTTAPSMTETDKSLVEEECKENSIQLNNVEEENEAIEKPPRLKRQKIHILFINTNYNESLQFATTLKQSMKNHTKFTIRMKYIPNYQIALQFFQQYYMIEEHFPNKLRRYDIDIIILDTNILYMDGEISKMKMNSKLSSIQESHLIRGNLRKTKREDEDLPFRMDSPNTSNNHKFFQTSLKPNSLNLASTKGSNSNVPVRIPYLSQSSFEEVVSEDDDNIIPSPYNRLTDLLTSIHDIYNNQIMIGILYDNQRSKEETVERLQNYIPNDNLIDFFWKKPIAYYYYSLLPFLLENHCLYYQDYSSSHHFFNSHYNHHPYTNSRSHSSSNDSIGNDGSNHNGNSNNNLRTILPNCSYDSLTNEDSYDRDLFLELPHHHSNNNSSKNNGLKIELSSSPSKLSSSTSLNVDDNMNDLIFTDVCSVSRNTSIDQADVPGLPISSPASSFLSNAGDPNYGLPPLPNDGSLPLPPPPIFHQSPLIQARRSKRIDSLSSVDEDPMFQNTFLNSFNEQSKKITKEQTVPQNNRKLVKSESFTNGSSYITAKQAKLQKQLKENADLYDKLSNNANQEGIASGILNFLKTWGLKSNNTSTDCATSVGLSDGIPGTQYEEDLNDKPFSPLKKAYSNDFLINQKNYPSRFNNNNNPTQQPSNTTQSTNTPPHTIKRGRVFL